MGPRVIVFIFWEGESKKKLTADKCALAKRSGILIYFGSRRPLCGDCALAKGLGDNEIR